MADNLTTKIIKAHLVEGELIPGREIGIRIDQTLLQDATGTMALLEFESLGLDRVRADLSVQYVDHNLLQTDFKNADDHAYLRTASAPYGLVYSQPGTGISHQVHMERFGRPGLTIIGSDSHTPGAAGISMLGIGAGGLDVALAMAGRPYYLPCPRILGVRLSGGLPDWVSAKDLILEMLRRYDVKGRVGHGYPPEADVLHFYRLNHFVPRFYLSRTEKMFGITFIPDQSRIRAVPGTPWPGSEPRRPGCPNVDVGRPPAWS